MARIIDLKLLLRLILKRWYLFVIVAVAALITALYLTAEVQPDVYEATASISSIAEGSYSDSLSGIRVLNSYFSLITSERIASAAREILPDSLSINSRQIQSMTSTSFNENFSVLFITCRSADSQLAQSVVNAVAEAFIAEISNITGDDTVRIYDRATGASMAFNGRSEQRRSRVTIPAVSLFLLFVAVVLWALFSDRIKSVSEAELNGEIPVIGVIPRSKEKRYTSI